MPTKGLDKPIQVEILSRIADAFDPDATVRSTERDVCDFAARNMERGIAPFDDDEMELSIEFLPPLYEPDSQDGWRSNIDMYNMQQARAWVSRELFRCEKSAHYFLTRYCYSQNEHADDGKPPAMELVPCGDSPITKLPWVHPEAMCRAFESRHDVIIEKSRDMMVSWLSMMCLLWEIGFKRMWKAMTLSRVESLVDDGGEASRVDSLHGKVRFVHQNLPPFLRASIPLQFSYLKITNPMLESHVTGFSATPSAGRGPKWQRAILDEFAHVPWSQQVMSSVTRACPSGKVLISTPMGKNNEFARIVHDASRPVWPKPSDNGRHWHRYTIHWSCHPERGIEWYENEKKTQSMTDEALAQELDISYTRSVGRRVYPRFLREVHVAGASPMSLLPTVEYEPHRPLYVCCDFNHDPLIWVLMQPHATAPRFRVIGEICRRNAVYEDAIREFIVRFGTQNRVNALLARNGDWRDVYGKNGICVAGSQGHIAPVVIYGDATEEKSTVHNRVKMYQLIRSALKEAEFDVAVRVPKQNPPRITRFETMNDALSKGMIAIHESCTQLVKDLEEGVWNTAGDDMDQRTEDDDNSHLTRSHASSALGYCMVTLHKLTTSVGAVAKAKEGRPLGEMIKRVLTKW